MSLPPKGHCKRWPRSKRSAAATLWRAWRRDGVRPIVDEGVDTHANSRPNGRRQHHTANAGCRAPSTRVVSWTVGDVRSDQAEAEANRAADEAAVLQRISPPGRRGRGWRRRCGILSPSQGGLVACALRCRPQGADRGRGFRRDPRRAHEASGHHAVKMIAEHRTSNAAPRSTISLVVYAIRQRRARRHPGIVALASRFASRWGRYGSGDETIGGRWKDDRASRSRAQCDAWNAQR